MANNIKIGRNTAIGLVDINFDDIAQFTESSIQVITQYIGMQTLTWKKNRTVNGVNKFTADGQYVIKALQAMDITAFAANTRADVSQGPAVILGDTDGSAIGDNDGTVIQFT